MVYEALIIIGLKLWHLHLQPHLVGAITIWKDIFNLSRNHSSLAPLNRHVNVFWMEPCGQAGHTQLISGELAYPSKKINFWWSCRRQT